MNGRAEQINKLLSHVKNETSYTAIQKLISTYEPEVINGKGNHGMTALHHACARLSTTVEGTEKNSLAKNIISLLLQHRAKATLHNNENQTPADLLKEHPVAAAWFAEEIKTREATTSDDLLLDSPTTDLTNESLEEIERHDQDHVKLNLLFALLSSYTQKNKTNRVEYIIAGVILVPALMLLLDKYDLLPITHSEHMSEHPAQPTNGDWMYVGLCLFIAIGYSAITYLSSKKSVDTEQVKKLRDELEKTFGDLMATNDADNNDDALLSNLPSIRSNFKVLQQYLGEVPLTEVVIADNSDDENDDHNSIEMRDRIHHSFDAIRSLAKNNKQDGVMTAIHSLHESVQQFRYCFTYQPHPLAFFKQPTAQQIISHTDLQEELPPPRQIANQ